MKTCWCTTSFPGPFRPWERGWLVWTTLYIIDINRCLLLRSATGENWQLIMLACTTGAWCDEKVGLGPEANCGSIMTYPYFLSFIFFCSFLVSVILTFPVGSRPSDLTQAADEMMGRWAGSASSRFVLFFCSTSPFPHGLILRLLSPVSWAPESHCFTFCHYFILLFGLLSKNFEQIICVSVVLEGSFGNARSHFQIVNHFSQSDWRRTSPPPDWLDYTTCSSCQSFWLVI